MRVLFIPSWYPSDKNPFAGAFIHDLAVELVSQGMEIEVVAAHQHFMDFMLKSTATEESNGVTVHHLFGWTPPKMTKRLQNIWIDDCCKRVDELVDFSKIDIIHAQDYVGLFLANRLAQRYDKSLLCTLHHSDFLMDLIPSWRKSMLQEILPYTDKCIVPSTAMSRAIQEQGHVESDQLLVIPNYIRINQIKAKDVLGESPKKYIMVSSAEAVKRPELSIEWMNDLPGKLDIYGSVPNRRQLANRIRKRGLADRLKLKGTLPHRELLQKYCEYDALISTSSHETFGISIIEALAAGIPALVASRTGPLDYIDNQTGILVKDRGDLRGFVENYQKFDAVKIRSKTSNQFDVSVVVPQHLSLYRKIFAERCVV